jgi:sugar lactone lactonase YvrE
MVDLNAIAPEGRHVANDVAVDADGNAYVTDSFSPVIYKVDPDGNASVFVTDPQLGNENLGLNGIAYHPDGYLIAAVTGAGTLVKIPLDNPTGLTPVQIDSPVPGDGLIFDSEGNLIAVGAQADQKVYKLSSEDEWATATVAGTYAASQLVTTAAVGEDDAPYVLYTSFDPAAPAGSYQIVPVAFEG